MTDIYLAGEAALWVQPDGPNTKPEFLGCHQMGDLTNPLGEMTVKFCPDPAVQGRYKAATWFQGEPGVITTSLTTYIGSVADWLGKIARRRCPFPLYVFKGNCGRRDVFYAWERGFGLNPAVLTQRLLSNLAAREPGDEGASEQTFDIGAMEFHEWFDLSIDPMSTPSDMEVAVSASIWTCSMPQCAVCENKLPCNDMIVGADHSVGADSKVWYSLDQGASWTECAVAPFFGLANAHIESVVCFPIDATTTRWLVSSSKNTTTPEVAYSDDRGNSWTRVVVATIVAVEALGPRTLFASDMNHIWIAYTKGYIFFSSDGGATWTEQWSEGTIALQAIWFSDDLHGMAVSDNDDIIITSDGGVVWTEHAGATGSGDCLLSITENAGGGIWWTGTEAAKLFYSTDFGITWTRRLGWQGEGSGDVIGIRFANRLSGFLIHNTNGWYYGNGNQGEILQTVNGGYSWKLLSMPEQDGLIDLTVGDENLAFALGKGPDYRVGLIVKVHE